MPETLAQITARYFCAGLVIRGDRCTEAAPILAWAVGRTRDELRAYFVRKGWRRWWCERRMESMDKPRLRKAWHVWPTWADQGPRDIVYAQNAGKARYSQFLSCDGQTAITELIARRAKANDVILPPRDPICDDLSERAIEAMQHTYGISSHNPYRAGYRNYYCTCPGDPVMTELKNAGLAEVFSSVPDQSGNVVYRLTKRGIQVAISTDHEYAPWPKTKAADPKAGG